MEKKRTTLVDALRQSLFRSFALLISLGVHIALLGTLFVCSFFHNMPSVSIKPIRHFEQTVELYEPPQTPLPNDPPSPIPPNLPYSEKTVFNLKKIFSKIQRKDAQNLLDESKKIAEKMPDKSAHLDKMIALQEKSVSEKGQQEVLEFLGGNFEAHEYTPRKNSPPGEFNWDSFTIHDIQKLESPPGYEVVFVDKEGRTKTERFFKNDATAYDAVYKVFEISRNNKMLQPLLMYVLKSTPKWIEHNHVPSSSKK